MRIYSIHLHHLDAEKRTQALAKIFKDAEGYKDVMIIGDYNSITESDGWLIKGYLGNIGYDVIKFVVKNGYHDAYLHLHGNEFERLKDDNLAHTYPSAPFEKRVRIETGMIEPIQRIDYFFVSENLKDRIRSIEILRAGHSDHDPVCCVVDVGK